MFHCVVLCCVVLHYVALCCVVLRCVVLCCQRMLRANLHCFDILADRPNRNNQMSFLNEILELRG